MNGNNVAAIRPANAVDDCEAQTLRRIATLGAQLSDEVARLERANHRRAEEVYARIGSDRPIPGMEMHPAIKELRAREQAAFNARQFLQTGVMWLRRGNTHHEGF